MSGASTCTVAESRMRIFIFLWISSMLVLQGRAAETPASPSRPTVHLDPGGEHVCRNPSYMAQTRPGVLVESYCKPVFKPYSVRCGYNTLCTRYRTVYYLGYRQRYPGYQTQQVSRQNPLVDQTGQTRYKCCPGWTQAHKRSSQCSTPVCDTECQHGGRCVSPDTCACPAGWTGRACEVDVNECDFDHHGCSQLCKNSNGSHQCGCYEGFSLMADGRTCQVCITCSHEFQALLARVELIERELGEMKKNHTLFSSLGPPIEAAQVPAPTSIPIPGNNLILNDQHISQIERIQSLSEQISMLEERLDGSSSPPSLSSSSSSHQQKHSNEYNHPYVQELASESASEPSTEFQETA